MAARKFAIVITTKNRLADLSVTLNNLRELIGRDDTCCIVCDDGSTDGTSEFITTNFPEIQLIQNWPSKGYLFSRNRLLEMADAEFAVSLDDDAHFLSADPFEKIEQVFSEFPQCGVMAFRIFWGKNAPDILSSAENNQQVKSFVGCGHAWRMKAWKEIPQYPEWFEFYGEEDFAAYELYQKNWRVIYAPSVLVQHRADLNARKNDPDYLKRLRRSLASGWYLYFLFLPMPIAFRKFAASIGAQFRNRIFKGKLAVLSVLFLALTDLLTAMPKLRANRNALTKDQLRRYQSLSDAKIFWKPETDKHHNK